jgi:hypothetical protein
MWRDPIGRNRATQRVTWGYNHIGLHLVGSDVAFSYLQSTARMGPWGKWGGGVVGSTGMGGAAGGASADPRRGLPAAPAGARRGARPLAAVVLG